ncbi:MAG TPA: cation:proton antiporter [Limnochordia bacterium]|mgnify:CR=1 FL=1|nr:cation:proton antiporter [Limnochordia bacterium]
MVLLFKAAILTLAGCLAGKLAKSAGVSKLFGYLLAGLILGPSLFSLISGAELAALFIAGEVVLAVVAFKIGSELVFKDLQGVDRSFLAITLGEVAGTVFAVFGLLYFLLRQDLTFSLIMATAAVGSAPTAALMVMRQYRARGAVASTLLPVAAVNGVLGVVLFALVLSLARAHGAVQGGSSGWQLVSTPLLELGGSVILGGVLGVIFAFLAKKAGDTDELLIMSLAMILVAAGGAYLLGLSPLVANIVLGLMLANLGSGAPRVFFCLNSFTPPIYLLFFTLVGASLQLAGLLPLLALGAAYILARAAGKLLGTWVGAWAAQAEPKVQKYLGVLLLPQGGVSLALAALLHRYFPQYSGTFTVIMVLSVLLLEALGPRLARAAFARAEEVTGLGRQLIG